MKIERMWSEHSEYLKRMLIALTHDFDLADDLLQETYLRAQNGVSDYRGEGDRAWLTAIAKNVLLNYKRRKYNKLEIPLDMGDQADDLCEPSPGSSSHIDLISLRQALADLDRPLRTALIMKHYGGFSYQEIAKQLSCPQGTAQRRIWDAVQKLRAALDIESASIGCDKLRGMVLLDYVYGTVPPAKAAKVAAHLQECRSCRQEAAELRTTAKALDAVESDFKLVYAYELNDKGGYTGYSTIRIDGRILVDDEGNIRLRGHSGEDVSFVAVNGEESRIEFRSNGKDDPDACHIIHPSKRVAKEDPLDLFMVFENDCVSGADKYLRRILSTPIEELQKLNELYLHKVAEQYGGHEKLVNKWAEMMGGRERVLRTLPEGVMRMVEGHWPTDCDQGLIVISIRIPKKLRLVDMQPAADQVQRSRAGTTLMWRRVISPSEPILCMVEYSVR